MPLCSTCGPVAGAHPVRGCPYYRADEPVTAPTISVTPPISVTHVTASDATASGVPELGRKAGRPKKRDALSAADKQRAYRQRKRAITNP